MTVTFLYNQKVTGSKEVLNKLSILADKASKEYERKGQDGLAYEAKEIADAIYYALADTGFYK